MRSRAAEFAESLGYRKLGDPPGGWTRITRESHPTLHDMMRTIMHDGGGGADHDSFNIPPAWSAWLDRIEDFVSARLDDEEREMLAIGEHSECMALIARPGMEMLRHAHQLLNAFFEDWVDCEEPPRTEVSVDLMSEMGSPTPARSLGFRNESGHILCPFEWARSVAEELLDKRSKDWKQIVICIVNKEAQS